MGMAKGLTKLLKKGIFCIAIAIKCDVTGEGTLIVLTLAILGRTGSTSVGCWEEDLGLSAAGLQKTWSTEMLVVRLIQAACRCVPHAAGVMDQEEDVKRREGVRDKVGDKEMLAILLFFMFLFTSLRRPFHECRSPRQSSVFYEWGFCEYVW